MIFADGLFGRIGLPEWTRAILLSPEVQRLRDVRLINTSSPYLPALSDARRFTHSIGVTHLAASALPRLRHHFSTAELRSFLAAAVVHDVGSPPFGHLFEYLLKAQSGWTHEAALAGILKGEYRPDNIYHQIYYGKALSLGRAFERVGVDPDMVARLVLGDDALGPLIAGTIDFDNIDNVYRMTSLLGLDPDLSAARSLADALDVEDGRLIIHESGLTSLEVWRSLRRRAYELLAFDSDALSGQAMLTDAISCAMDAGSVSAEQWFWTDDELLRQLCSPQQSRDIREPAQRFVVGDFYRSLGVFWYALPDGGGPDLRAPENRRSISRDLTSELGIECVIYAFYDKGTFEKQLSLQVKDVAGQISERSIGSTSRSTIVGVFSPRRNVGKRSVFRTGILRVLENAGLRSDAGLQIPIRGEVLDVDSQAQLPF